MKRILDINSYSSLRFKKINNIFSNNRHIEFKYTEYNNDIISFNLNMRNCIGIMNTIHIIQNSIQNNTSYQNIIEVPLNSVKTDKFLIILAFYRYENSNQVGLTIKRKNILTNNIEPDIRILIDNCNIEQLYDIFEGLIIDRV